MNKVTAHDFYDEFHAHNDLPGVFFPDECEKGIEALLPQVRAQAYAEGRLEGLKEMDEAHHMIFGKPYSECVELQKLRLEYQSPN